MPPKLEYIDHIHINVSNRAASEAWYQDFLGFVPDPIFAPWVTDQGPLTLVNRDGNIHLALFERAEIQNTVIAFNVSATGLDEWVQHLTLKGISVVAVDHDLSWSIYFRDLDGNPFEITTYEYSEFKNKCA